MLGKLSFTTLTNVAVGVAITGTFGIYMLRMSYQEKVRNLPHYQEALKILFEHESAKELLGTPIKVAHIDLGDRRNNYVGKLESKLLVPISGTINSGLLNIYADRPSIEDQFKAKKIRLELEEESILVYERDS